MTVRAEDAQIVGAQVRRRRLDRGWSQAQLSARFNDVTGRAWDRDKVMLIENGRRSMTFSEGLVMALLLGVDPYELDVLPEDEDDEE